MAVVFVPPTMRSLTDGLSEIRVEGNTVRDVIRAVDRQFPGFAEQLCYEDSLRPGWSVVVGGSVSALGLLARVGPDEELHFLPALGGG